MDEARDIASLGIRCRIERLTTDKTRLTRVEELFQRTTQFNTTGYKFSFGELAALANNPNAALFTIDVSDRFGDHGLVGAAVIENSDLLGLALSCRVLGMGVEHQFLQYLIAEIKKTRTQLSGRIIETSRNTPVRNIYRDNGFTEVDGGLWQLGF